MDKETERILDAVLKSIRDCVKSDFYKDQTVSAAQCIEWVRKQVPACKLSDKALANAIAEFAIDYHLPIEFDAAERK